MIPSNVDYLASLPLSSMPSDNPSEHPSVSDWPTSQPSSGPSLSSQPSSPPSSSPSLRFSNAPSISTQPSGQPTSQPSLKLSIRQSTSTIPGSMPSFSPSSGRSGLQRGRGQLPPRFIRRRRWSAAASSTSCVEDNFLHAPEERLQFLHQGNNIVHDCQAIDALRTAPCEKVNAAGAVMPRHALKAPVERFPRSSPRRPISTRRPASTRRPRPASWPRPRRPSPPSPRPTASSRWIFSPSGA